MYTNKKTPYDKPNIAGVNYDQQISFGTASEVFHSLSLAGNLHNYGDPEGATKKFDYDHEISFGTASEVFHSLHNLQSNDGYAEIRGMEDRMNTLDTRALSNNTAGTSEYTEDETEDETEDFLDAKSDDGKHDKFEIRNRVTADTRQDTKDETEKKDAKTEENKMKDDDDEVQHDTLELRAFNETFSPVADLGQTKNETEKNEGDPGPRENKKNIEVSEGIRDQGGGGVEGR